LVFYVLLPPSFFLRVLRNIGTASEFLASNLTWETDGIITTTTAIGKTKDTTTITTMWGMNAPHGSTNKASAKTI
jgi:hypothetical protein